MTTRIPNTDARRWKSVTANFVAAKEAVGAVAHFADCDVTNRIHDLLNDVEQSVYSTTAPDLGAVAEKLEVYWGEELFAADDYVAFYKRRIIGDIRRNHLLIAGIDNEDASGGMDLQRVAAEWADALQEHNQYAQFLEAGPSDRRQYSKKSDMVALKNESEAKLLALPAPNIAAVIRKLELLWADDRFDCMSHYCHCCVMRDLHRLKCQIAS